MRLFPARPIAALVSVLLMLLLPAGLSPGTAVADIVGDDEQVVRREEEVDPREAAAADREVDLARDPAGVVADRRIEIGALGGP